jgi:hypothetical protein
MDLTLRVMGGLEGMKVEPERVRLEPAQEVSVRIAGNPTGDRIGLEVTGPFGRRECQMEVRRVPAGELLPPMPEGGVLAPVRYDEAEALAHRSGERRADPAASDEAVWAADQKVAEPGYVVYGPYAPLEAGKYLALFRLKRTGEGTGPLALLDTCVAGGQPQTGTREVSAEELPLNEFRWAPLLMEHPGGNFETRVVWTGRASLTVDSVALWRVQE